MVKSMNNPLRFIDPTGHWSCSGRDDCEGIIDIWLNLLDDAGSLGSGLRTYFEASDINVEFKQKHSAIMSAKNEETITIDSSRIDNRINDEGIFGHVQLMTLFGHELEHTRQGFVDSRSVQAEYYAYETQIRLAEEWDKGTGGTVAIDMLFGNGSRNTRRIYLANFRDWDTVGSTLNPNSHSDMETFRTDYLSAQSDYYNRIPAFPLGEEISYQFNRITNALTTQISTWLQK